jgi:transposase
MITQPGLRKNASLSKFVIGAHPIIQVYLDRLRVAEIIATHIQQDQRLKVPIEQTLSILIHNVLSSPMPMYELGDWLAPLDEKCMRLDRSEVAFIHDDRVGKALELFYDGRHQDVFFHLALRAIKLFELDCSQIHQDTTSITFCGKYSGWGASELLAHGHNKDHRPDLKQLVLGMSVTADGCVPLTHRVYDGNQSDDRVHRENHQRLRRLLQKSDFIYVADCKLSADYNLKRIDACGGSFVTVMPRTWKEDTLFRKRVRQEKVEWDHLLSRRNNRKPKSKMDRYYLALGPHSVKGYRVLWIRSTQKAEQDAETRTQHIEKAWAALQDLQTRLNTYNLKSRLSIEQAIHKILKEHHVREWILYQIDERRQYQKRYDKPGRPKASNPGRRTWNQYFSLTFSVDEEAVQQEAMTDGIFPILTNLDKDKYKPRKVLQIYKFQPFLEKRHSQLKTCQAVTPVLLKKAQRVVAYLHMHVMALMVATLIERKLRLAVKKHGLDALPLYPENRPCPYPTMFDIVRAFQGVERYEVVDGEKLTVFPAKLSPLQKKVLELLEVPASLYH